MVAFLHLSSKGNLNRQFLFRASDIQKPKSETAARAVLEMNPRVHVDSQTYKVCPETEHVYTDEFFRSQTCIVNALDNVQVCVSFYLDEIFSIFVCLFFESLHYYESFLFSMNVLW